jgi:transcriptional regulator with XRE-family HTH domain
MSTPALAKPALTLSAAVLGWGETQVPRAVDRTTTQDQGDSIGARIAALRKERGLTQKELAERLAITQPVVSDYEHDVIRLPADVVVAIAKTLDVSTDALLGLKPEPRSAAGVRNRRLSRAACRPSMPCPSAIRRPCYAPSMPSFPRPSES